jgi:hypothetical protein
MRKATNDRDTWTHISVAAERVLARQNEQLVDRVEHHAHSDEERTDYDAQRAQCAGVVGDRKLALGSARVREEGGPT